MIIKNYFVLQVHYLRNTNDKQCLGENASGPITFRYVIDTLHKVK